jgi:hypothetical protein
LEAVFSDLFEGEPEISGEIMFEGGNFPKRSNLIKIFGKFLKIRFLSFFMRLRGF